MGASDFTKPFAIVLNLHSRDIERDHCHGFMFSDWERPVALDVISSSSYRWCSVGKDVPRNLVIITGKHLC